MDAVDERYQRRDREEHQQEVAEQEVVRPERHLHNLDDEFASRLGHRRRAEAATVPLTGPPCAVRLVVLELTREEYRDEELLDRALDGHDGDDTQNCVRDIPKLKEPL